MYHRRMTVNSIPVQVTKAAVVDMLYQSFWTTFCGSAMDQLLAHFSAYYRIKELHGTVVNVGNIDAQLIVILEI